MDETERDIAAWLEKGGAPLEMRVAEQFLPFAESVEQSAYYVDPTTEKPREIDVVARWQYDDKTFSVAVECKSKMDPLIILLSSRNDVQPVQTHHQLRERRFS